jgi:hypothetical protein
MKVVVASDGASLEDAEEFGAFDFVTDLGQAELARVVTELSLGAADADGEHVWFSVDAVTRLAGPLADEAWLGRLDGMVGYASTHGWVDDAGRVRAHRAG